MAVPLPSLTRQLNAAAEDPAFDAVGLRRILSRLHPALLAAMEDDATHPERFAAWGESSNREQEPEIELVHPRLLEALCQVVGLPQPEGDRTNAGLLHTYGYLLSNRRTTYGYKRERWTGRDLERGLHLRPGSVAPLPPEGTLLRNVTALMHAIWAFQPADISPSQGLSPFSRERPRLSGFTLTEEPDGTPVRLLTRVVRFGPEETGGALFHAWTDPQRLRLLTLFPVSDAKIEEFLQKYRTGPGTVKPRYNGVIPGLGSSGIPGQIRLESWES